MKTRKVRERDLYKNSNQQASDGFPPNLPKAQATKTLGRSPPQLEPVKPCSLALVVTPLPLISPANVLAPSPDTSRPSLMASPTPSPVLHTDVLQAHLVRIAYRISRRPAAAPAAVTTSEGDITLVCILVLAFPKPMRVYSSHTFNH